MSLAKLALGMFQYASIQLHTPMVWDLAVGRKGWTFISKTMKTCWLNFTLLEADCVWELGFLLLVEEWRGIGLKRSARGCWVEAAVVGAVSQGGSMAVKWTGMRFLCGQSVMMAEKGLGQSEGGFPNCPRGLTHLMLKPWRLLELMLTTPRLINLFFLHFCLELWYSQCSWSCLNSEYSWLPKGEHYSRFTTSTSPCCI